MLQILCVQMNNNIFLIIKKLSRLQIGIKKTKQPVNSKGKKVQVLLPTCFINFPISFQFQQYYIHTHQTDNLLFLKSIKTINKLFLNPIRINFQFLSHYLIFSVHCSNYSNEM